MSAAAIIAVSVVVLAALIICFLAIGLASMALTVLLDEHPDRGESWPDGRSGW